MHGSVKHKLAWSQPIDDVPFDPVLVLLAEVSYGYIYNFFFYPVLVFKVLRLSLKPG